MSRSRGGWSCCEYFPVSPEILACDRAKFHALLREAAGRYERLGYLKCGGIPDHAMDPDGTLKPT